ncbi:MAG TPA: electron transfer flavoprotein subunit beta, partial [Porphyromonadaceae bacterium]|nr:electron transfer flavoprotein subunit beta [Porphyromonadaceae bacterium]
MAQKRSFRIVVLAKQVPDTQHVGKDSMKEDGTINRCALPAIFNPEDLNALEMGLKLKEQNESSTLQVITMGPTRATDIIRESLFRGADGGILLSDRCFAGSDTLATSYTLASAIKKLGEFDVILCGRQAIDGDTAQVGPQVAEKLHIPQVCYAKRIESIDEEGKLIICRKVAKGEERVRVSTPLLITVCGEAEPPRPCNAKNILKYKYAKTEMEREEKETLSPEFYLQRPYLNIPTWGAKDINASEECIGFKGSPTKVKSVENVVFTSKESKKMG